MDQQLLVSLLGAATVAGLGWILLSGDGGTARSSRVRELSGEKTLQSTLRARLKQDESTGSRRKQIEETLGKIEERQKAKKKKAKSLQARLIQASWKTKPQTFVIISTVIAVVVFAIAFIVGAPLPMALGGAAVAGFGLPRFWLNFAINRRQKKFINHFADGMDIIVRGVRTGLPLGDCLKIIAHESPDPLGEEFRRVVEGESIGIPLEVCLEQMYERMPISEVNFFATVLNIQKTTGGNLGESLDNLSGVLRGRKILAQKIKSLSAEAKMSAMIIGAMPIVVGLLISILSPEYMTELFTTERGQTNLMIGAGMMVVGIIWMRKMINFKY